jgi:group I intron endonuclease
MRISGIYKIQSRIKPERVYIGSSVNIRSRWSKHRGDLIRQIHDNGRLQNHANKYGLDDLEFSLIVGCSEDTIIAYEQFYIDALVPWFNINPNAGTSRGVIHESRRGKPSWAKGRKFSEEHKGKISKSMSGENNPMYGRPSPIKGTKGKYPNKWKGKTGRYSEETLIKRGLANKLAWEKRKQKQKEMEESHAGN